jgi:hypothetical protein
LKKQDYKEKLPIGTELIPQKKGNTAPYPNAIIVSQCHHSKYSVVLVLDAQPSTNTPQQQIGDSAEPTIIGPRQQQELGWAKKQNRGSFSRRRHGILDNASGAGGRISQSQEQERATAHVGRHSRWVVGSAELAKPHTWVVRLSLYCALIQEGIRA